MERSASFSPDRVYRYELWRSWADPARYAMFVGLNPSTADETEDDPTIRRCINYVKAWGFGALAMTNIFAFRATDPAVMKRAADPIGPDNDSFLRATADRAGIIVAAWGVHGIHRGRDREVRAMLPTMRVLGLTADGHPKHPLYLRASLTPLHWPQERPKIVREHA